MLSRDQENVLEKEPKEQSKPANSNSGSSTQWDADYELAKAYANLDDLKAKAQKDGWTSKQLEEYSKPTVDYIDRLNKFKSGESTEQPAEDLRKVNLSDIGGETADATKKYVAPVLESQAPVRKPVQNPERDILKKGEKRDNVDTYVANAQIAKIYDGIERESDQYNLSEAALSLDKKMALGKMDNARADLDQFKAGVGAAVNDYFKFLSVNTPQLAREQQERYNQLIANEDNLNVNDQEFLANVRRSAVDSKLKYDAYKMAEMKLAYNWDEYEKQSSLLSVKTNQVAKQIAALGIKEGQELTPYQASELQKLKPQIEALQQRQQEISQATGIDKTVIDEMDAVRSRMAGTREVYKTLEGISGDEYRKEAQELRAKQDTQYEFEKNNPVVGAAYELVSNIAKSGLGMMFDVGKLPKVTADALGIGDGFGWTDKLYAAANNLNSAMETNMPSALGTEFYKTKAGTEVTKDANINDLSNIVNLANTIGSGVGSVLAFALSAQAGKPITGMVANSDKVAETSALWLSGFVQAETSAYQAYLDAGADTNYAARMAALEGTLVATASLIMPDTEYVKSSLTPSVINVFRRGLQQGGAEMAYKNAMKWVAENGKQAFAMANKEGWEEVAEQVGQDATRTLAGEQYSNDAFQLQNYATSYLAGMATSTFLSLLKATTQRTPSQAKVLSVIGENYSEILSKIKDMDETKYEDLEKDLKGLKSTYDALMEIPEFKALDRGTQDRVLAQSQRKKMILENAKKAGIDSSLYEKEINDINTEITGILNSAKESPKTQEDDSENKSGVSSTVGEQEGPIQTEPNQGASTAQAGTGGVVQEAQEVEPKALTKEEEATIEAIEPKVEDVMQSMPELLEKDAEEIVLYSIANDVSIEEATKAVKEMSPPKEGDEIVIPSSEKGGEITMQFNGESWVIKSVSEVQNENGKPATEKGAIGVQEDEKSKDENIGKLIVSERKVDVLDEVTDEKTGEKIEKTYKIKFEDGAESHGSIKGNRAYIVHVRAPKKEGSVIEPKIGTKVYERLIEKLRENGVTEITVNLQSKDSRAALSKLVEKGVLVNPRNMRGPSIDEHPSTFDIAQKEKIMPDAEEKEALGNSTEQELKAAEEATETDITEEEKESGEYPKEVVTIQGLDISIETPKGEERTWKDKKGTVRSMKLKNTYGYINDTVGADKEEIDVFIGDNLDSKKVYIVDQFINGRFDEHKVMIGFDNANDAKKAYNANYTRGWKGFDSIHEMDITDFKMWLEQEDTTKRMKPFIEQKKYNDTVNELIKLKNNYNDLSVVEKQNRQDLLKDIKKKSEALGFEIYLLSRVRIQLFDKATKKPVMKRGVKRLEKELDEARVLSLAISSAEGSNVEYGTLGGNSVRDRVYYMFLGGLAGDLVISTKNKLPVKEGSSEYKALKKRGIIKEDGRMAGEVIDGIISDMEGMDASDVDSQDMLDEVFNSITSREDARRILITDFLRMIERGYGENYDPSMFKKKKKEGKFDWNQPSSNYDDVPFVKKPTEKKTSQPKEEETEEDQTDGEFAKSVFSDLGVGNPSSDGKTLAFELPELLDLANAVAGADSVKVRKMKGALGAFFRNKLKIVFTPELFLPDNRNDLLKVFAHEIGHLVDFFAGADNATLERGNILGRIASLKNFLQEQLPFTIGAEGPLTEEEKKAMKQQAKNDNPDVRVVKMVDEMVEQIDKFTAEDILRVWNDVDFSKLEGYKELYNFIQTISEKEKAKIVKAAIKGIVNDPRIEAMARKTMVPTGAKIEVEEIIKGQWKQAFEEAVRAETERRRLFQLEQIANEAYELSKAWRPIINENDPKEMEYRRSSKEIYADMMSVLFTDPGRLEQMAPNFYKAFMNYLDAKPQFKAAYQDIMQQMTDRDAIIARRIERERAGMRNAAKANKEKAVR